MKLTLRCKSRQHCFHACMHACKCVCCPYHHPVSCDFFGQEKMERVRRLQAQLLSEPTRRVDETPPGPVAPGWVLRMQYTVSTCMSKVNVHAYMSWNMLTVRSQVRDSMLLKVNKVNMHLVPRRHKNNGCMNVFFTECCHAGGFGRCWPYKGPCHRYSLSAISCTIILCGCWCQRCFKNICNNLLFCSSNRWGCHSDLAITRWCTKGGRAFIQQCMQYDMYVYIYICSAFITCQESGACIPGNAVSPGLLWYIVSVENLHHMHDACMSSCLHAWPFLAHGWLNVYLYMYHCQDLSAKVRLRTPPRTLEKEDVWWPVVCSEGHSCMTLAQMCMQMLRVQSGQHPPHQSRRWSKHWQLIHKLLRILQLSQRLLALQLSQRLLALQLSQRLLALQLSQRLLALQLSHMLLALQLGPRLLAHLQIVLRLCSRPTKIVGIVQQMSFVRPCWLWALLDKYLQRSLPENWLVYMLKSMTWRTRKTKKCSPEFLTKNLPMRCHSPRPCPRKHQTLPKEICWGVGKARFVCKLQRQPVACPLLDMMCPMVIQNRYPLWQLWQHLDLHRHPSPLAKLEQHPLNRWNALTQNVNQLMLVWQTQGSILPQQWLYIPPLLRMWTRNSFWKNSGQWLFDMSTFHWEQLKAESSFIRDICLGQEWEKAGFLWQGGPSATLTIWFRFAVSCMIINYVYFQSECLCSYWLQSGFVGRWWTLDPRKWSMPGKTKKPVLQQNISFHACSSHACMIFLLKMTLAKAPKWRKHFSRRDSFQMFMR